MSVYAIIILAFGMSMDAFAASVGKGAALHRPPFREALRTGIIFGSVEAITPVVGWAIGLAASQYVMQWDHWIAFTLLMTLGARMVYEGIKKERQKQDDAPQRHSFWILVTTAIATSLDAMAVGVGLALLDVNIVLTAALIGLATLIMATTGMLLGRLLGAAIGKWAEITGGLVLILIGCTILLEHLTVQA